MTSKGDSSTKSKDLSASHSGPVIIKAHNLKNRVPLSSLANRSDLPAAMAKPTTDGVTVTELDSPSASDSVEFALQSLFNSETSIFVSTPNSNPRHISLESVEKILKSPSGSDDDDVTVVYDSYASQNEPNAACDTKLPVRKPSVGEPAKATKVLILRKKNSDIGVKSAGKGGNSTPAQSTSPVKTGNLTPARSTSSGSSVPVQSTSPVKTANSTPALRMSPVKAGNSVPAGSTTPVRTDNSTPARNTTPVKTGNSTPAPSKAAVKTGNSKPAQSTFPVKTGNLTPVRSTTPIKTGNLAPAQGAAPVKTGKLTPAQSTTPVNTGNSMPAKSTTPVKTGKSTPAQSTTTAKTGNSMPAQSKASIRTGNSTAVKSTTPVKNDRLTNAKSIQNSGKSICDSSKSSEVISDVSSSLTTANGITDAKPECKSTNKKVSNSKAVGNSASQVRPTKNPGDREGTVENELEKMFAGIEDGVDPSAATKQLAASATSAAMSSPSAPPPKSNKVPAKRNRNRPKNAKPTAASKGVKDKQNPSSFPKQSLDPNKKVPVIHIEGSIENPLNAHIVNSRKSEEDESINGRLAVKRKLGSSDPAVKTTPSNFALKNHDSVSSDATWVCVFCNLSANVPGMAGEATGDLFGPYFIRMPDQVNSEESKTHSWRNLHPEQAMKRRKGSTTDVSPSDEQKSVEVWAHENCIVWASGVHLIGTKLIGLEEAVMQALETTCTHCSNRGASIGCRARNCHFCAHCTCALHSGWKLDTETFISTCSAHSAPPN